MAASEQQQQPATQRRLARAYSSRGAALPETAMLQVPGSAEPLQLVLSSRPEVLRVQKTMVEAWALMSQAFFDSDRVSGDEWPAELRLAMERAAEARTPQQAYDELNTMTAKLNDPYTRVRREDAADDFLADGKPAIEGVGVVVATDPRTGAAIVVAPIEGGPAAKAGVLPGDQIIAIDGVAVEALSARGVDAASQLRGALGSAVRLEVWTPPRSSAAADAGDSGNLRSLNLRRGSVRMQQVVARALTLPPSARPLRAGERESSRARAAAASHPLGYIRLSAFGESAPEQMRQAIRDLQKQRCDHFVLDLRSNAGGLVSSGLQIAALFLDGGVPVISVVGRDGDVQQVATPKNLVAETHAPLAVLVDRGSASATEIVAGALRDTARATLVGERTFGKGRIQEVFDLGDGSKLFLSVASYRTPALRQIDRVGLAPDVACAAPVAGRLPSAAVRAAAGAEESGLGESAEADACVVRANSRLMRAMSAAEAGLDSAPGPHNALGGFAAGNASMGKGDQADDDMGMPPFA